MTVFKQLVQPQTSNMGEYGWIWMNMESY
jgi:hypothetical protein